MTATALPITWLIARAAGLVAFGLLTLSVWLGLAMSNRLLPPKRTKTLLGLHRTLAWTGLSMLVLHAGALLFDPFLHFNVLSVLIPGAAVWKPGTVAMGVVAGWLSLALVASFKAKKWIGQKGWRRLHYASFGAFALSVGHALTAGSDLHGVGGPVLAALAVGPTLFLLFVRILERRPRRQPTPAAARLARDAAV